MRRIHAIVMGLCALAAGSLAAPARAVSPVPVTFGTSWDAPGTDLQSIVDAYIGIPGAINVHTDYIGAKAGDVDPWFWVGDQIPAMLVTEIAGWKDVNTLGWYKETGVKPVIDNVDDGVVFAGTASAGASTVIVLPGGPIKFGFYLDPNGPQGAPYAPQGEYFFTNRFYNDIGPDGSGALHPPVDGDVQFLVFDVSKWKGANTWLVCAEDIDSGAPVMPCCTGTDDDFNDMVFEVTAFGATPTRAMTFGRLKALYR